MNYELYRCVITKENKKFFIGRDIFNKKYFIKKNRASSKFEVGEDYSFYAANSTAGFIIKRVVLIPIRYDDYINEIKKD